MRRVIYYIFFSLLISFAFYLKSEANDDYLLELKRKIDSSYYSFDTVQLIKILDEVDSAASVNTQWHLKYYSGMLHIIIGKILYNPNPDLAYDHFDKAVDDLLEADDTVESAEIKTLLSCAYGKKASLSTYSAIYFGLKAKSYIMDAYELDKNNPRIYLIAAIHLMHTPETFGGDKERAEKFLNRALILTQTKKFNDPLLLNWGGEAEIYAYFAQLEILQNNKEEAYKYIDKAKALVKNYGFVLFDLQKQIEKTED